MANRKGHSLLDIGGRVASLARRASAAATAKFDNIWEVENPNRLIIFDDCFPNLLSAFRVAEYNAYLRHFPDTQVYSNALTVTGGKSFGKLRQEYGAVYPDLVRHVRRFNHHRKFFGALAYTVFLNNVFPFLPAIERHSLPFIFTLYPGGGFQLDDPGSDAKLRRICSSPMLRGIITTQRVTHDYLVSKQFFDPARITFIYGGVLPLEKFAGAAALRKRKGADKQTFDLCFVANRYVPRGVDKGYDTFIDVAHRLARQRSDVRFHVVGNFNESDIDISTIRDRITFHGNQFTDWFPAFYASMDLIVSPNVPNRLAPGAFDGFPTGCCIEAGACGTAMVCTDVLNLNVGYKNGEEIVLTSPEPESVYQSIDDLLKSPESLYQLGERGRTATLKLFSNEAQVLPRIALLGQFISMER
jgi:glycosyltransferase involved in cell wall biosynthesis